MNIEIPGQFRGPECRVIPKAAIAIRRHLLPIFQHAKFSGISKISLVLRVGGSLGEFDPESGDGEPYREDKILICNIVIGNYDWAIRSEEEVVSIVVSHLKPVIEKCCTYLQLSDSFIGQVNGALAPLESRAFPVR